MSLVLPISGTATELLVSAVSEGGGEIDTEGVGERRSTKVKVGLLLASRATGGPLFRSWTSHGVRDGVRIGELFRSVVAVTVGLGLRSIDGMGV